MSERKCSCGRPALPNSRFCADLRCAAPIVGTDDTKAEPQCKRCGHKCSDPDEVKAMQMDAPTDKPAPRCSDGMACTMPGDCQRKGYCISDATDKPAPEPGNAWAPDNCPHCGGTNRLHKGWPCFGPAPDASASVLTDKLRAILADADADGGFNERDDPWDYRLVEAIRESAAELSRLSRELAEARDHGPRVTIEELAEDCRELQDELARARTLLWQADTHLMHEPTKIVIRDFLKETCMDPH